jgi:hypothetical protein
MDIVDIIVCLAAAPTAIFVLLDAIKDRKILGKN